MILLLALTAACSSNDEPASCAQLSVEDAWIREAPPGAPVLAGYMQLGNPGSNTIDILSASSADFERIEFHHTLNENGGMRMQALEFLRVPAGGKLTLSPGAQHMMLFTPTRALRAGDKVTMTLMCANNESLDIVYEVRRYSAEQDDHSHHH